MVEKIREEDLEELRFSVSDDQFIQLMKLLEVFKEADEKDLK